MFEFEIMVTGYTIIVASATASITKHLEKKKLDSIRLQLTAVQEALVKAENEIKILKKQNMT